MSGQDTATPIEMTEATSDDAVALVNAFQAILAGKYEDPVEGITFGLTAGYVFAGAMYGIAVSLGIESGKPSRVRKVMKMMERNFHLGMDMSIAQVQRRAAKGGSLQ